MSWAYASIDDLVAALPDETTDLTTAQLLELLTSAAREIDKALSPSGLRTFRTYLAALDFTPRSSWLEIPDLLTLTTLAQDTNGDRTFVTVWATANYDLIPFNAATVEEPYTQVRPSMYGPYSFSAIGWRGIGLSAPSPGRSGYGRWGYFPSHWHGLARSVRVTGKWGYWERTEDTGATTSEAVDLTETVVDISDQSLLSPGQTLLIDSEQIFLRSVTNGTPDTMTVDRGVNGTTVATHLISAPIYRYVYPAAARTATLAVIANAASAPGHTGLASERAQDIALTYLTAKDDPIMEQILYSSDLVRYRRVEAFI